MQVDSPFWPLSSHALSWLAGLIEGEGCLLTKKNGHPVVQLMMTDEDIVRRAKHACGVGIVNGPRLLPSGKKLYRWTVTRIEHAAGLIMTLYPLLGARRQKRAEEVLQRWKLSKQPRRLKTHCVHGHPLSGENLFVHEGRRRCKQCRNDRARKHRATKANLC